MSHSFHYFLYIFLTIWLEQIHFIFASSSEIQTNHAINSAGDCLTVVLYDKFGDGWDGAMWYIETPMIAISPASPNCTHNPVVKHVCGEKGQFYMMVLNGDEELPDNYWEVNISKLI